MLEIAAAAGINVLDTARAYGDSEKTIGLALAEAGLRDHFHIVTKTSASLATDLPLAEARKAIRESVETSLRLLRVDRLPAVLLHRDVNPAHLDALAELRETGLIARSGVSLGNAVNAARLLPHPFLEAIQAPVNVLDPRFRDATHGVHARGGLVFARSCYLQGLLLMDDTVTPPHLLIIKPARDFFRKLAEKQGIELSTLFLRAMLDRPDIDSVVVGMENRSQLEGNIRIFQSPPLPAELLAEIAEFSPDLPEWLIDPPQWSAHAAPASAS